MAAAMSALSPSGGSSDVLGAWDGFYLTHDGATGVVGSEFTEANHHRLVGRGTLFNLRNSDVDYDLRATMPQGDFITGVGTTSTGRLNFQGNLDRYRGQGGDAGVMSAEYQLLPSRGRTNRIDALLLHPFPGIATPDVSGNGNGTFASFDDPEDPNDQPDPSFTGVGSFQISPMNDRKMFAGRVEFSRAANQLPIFSWPLLATASEDGRVIMVSQGATGRIVYDGVVVPPSTPESQTFVGGFFRLRFNDGGSVFGAINFNLSR
jgi:hypothetical protein